MHKHIKTLGDAKAIARKNAKRDGCEWNIWWDTYHNDYAVAEPFANKDYWWSNKIVYKAKPFDDKEKDADGLITLTVTPEQAEFIQWVLEDEEDRQVYPGSEESKRSLLDMILGKKVKENAQSISG